VAGAWAGVKVASWNLEHFGTRKPDWALEVMAQSLKEFDIVAVQEVNAGPTGAKAVARLVEMLNRTGSEWDYRISDITTSDNMQERERYAFLWKKGIVRLEGRSFLATKLQDEICREPFIGTFSKGKQQFTLVSMHAVPEKKSPERELKYLKELPGLYQLPGVIFLGDFNCPESHTVFNSLKNQGLRPALTGQRTTLKQQCKDGNCLASMFDNILYDARIFKKKTSGVIYFYSGIEWINVKKVSDHLPVYAELD